MDKLGDDVAAALGALVAALDSLPGTFRPEFSLEYWSGVNPGVEAWMCRVEGDIHGDDNGSEFSILGMTASAALRAAVAELPKRIP